MSSPAPRNPGDRSHIRVANVTRSVGGHSPFTVVDDVSFSLEAGSYTAIAGPSGSGKSTVLSLLAGLVSPTAGTISIAGEDLTALTESERTAFRGRNVGFVFQSFHLLPRLSAAENVALPLVFQGVSRTARLERAQRLLTEVGLGDRLSHRPETLSGGEQQRVAIARAMVADPAVILADEPTGQLDSGTSDRILSLFDDLHADGRTLVVVTHSAAVARRADRVIQILDGRVVEDTVDHFDDADTVTRGASAE